MHPPSPFYSRYQMLPQATPPPSTPPLPPTYSSPHYVYPSSYPSYQAPVPYSPYVSPQIIPPHLSPPLHMHSNLLPPQTPIYASPPLRPTYQTHPNAESCEREQFYRKLHTFRDSIGEPIQRLPTLGFKELDLWVLYKEVIKRGGIDAVIAKKQWKEVAEALQLPSSCTDSGFRLRLHYKKYLEAFERKFFDAPVVDTKDRKKRGGSVTSSAVTVAEEGTVSNASCRSEGESFKEGKGRVVRKKKRSLARKEEEKMKEDKGEKDDDVVEQNDVVVDKGERKEEEGKGGEKEMIVDKENVVRNSEVHDGGGLGDCEDNAKRGAGEKGSQVRVDSLSRGRLSLLQAAALVGDNRVIRKGKKGGKVDFSVLESATLKRYARLHGVEQGEDKSNLADCVSRHFESMPLREGETATLLQFIHAVRRR